ncbi:MAG: hypothetical protein ACLS6G_08810 [Christensenellales bacterium]
MKAFGRIGMKICGDRPLNFLAQPAIMSVQRVAFLRKSGCRSAARLFHSSANRVAEMRKSGFEGLAHFFCSKSEILYKLPITGARCAPLRVRRYNDAVAFFRNVVGARIARPHFMQHLLFSHFLFLERRGLLWIQEIISWGRSAWAG